MKIDPRKLSVVIGALLLPVYPEAALAIPPPDIIIQVASQIGSFFAIGVVMCSAIFSVFYQYIQAYVRSHPKTFWSFSLIIVCSVSGTGAYLADRHYQQTKLAELAEENRDYPGVANTVLSGPLNVLIDDSALWFTAGEIGTLKSAPPNVCAPLSEDINVASGCGTEVDPLEVSSDDDQSVFYEQNKGLDLKISDTGFNIVLQESDPTEYIILDARENVEFELGHIPGSIHIRFADLIAGKWKELPDDKPIYVVCWSGQRGKMVVDFLREKRLVAQYLEEGVYDWATSFDGSWEGEVDFYKAYNAKRYKLLYSTAQVKRKLKEGVILVDSRQPERSARNHIDGSVAMSTLAVPSERLEELYAQVPTGSEVITICDEFVNCFDATVTGIELERRGVAFLGKYNKPWDF